MAFPPSPLSCSASAFGLLSHNFVWRSRWESWETCRAFLAPEKELGFAASAGKELIPRKDND